MLATFRQEGVTVKELPAPPDIIDQPDATELLRVWVVDQTLYCSIDSGAFPEPATWGVVLADLIRDLAQALQDRAGKDPQEVIQQIRAQFEAEIHASSAEARDEPVERDDIGQ
jgi:hypothetical protein